MKKIVGLLMICLLMVGCDSVDTEKIGDALDNIQVEVPVEKTPEVELGTKDNPYTIDNSDVVKAAFSPGAGLVEITNFANECKGKYVSFDGYIGAYMNYKDYDTRYTVLILPGDYNPDLSYGPNMVIKNIGGSYYNPLVFSANTNISVVLKIGSMDNNTLNIDVTSELLELR